MKQNQHHAERFPKRDPFVVPDGYLEGLTDRVMGMLPEKEREAVRVVSWSERIRPWLYMAAVFAGLLLFFKSVVEIPGPARKADNLVVKTGSSAGLYSVLSAEEDQEYLEFLESQYADYFLEDEAESEEGYE